MTRIGELAARLPRTALLCLLPAVALLAPLRAEAAPRVVATVAPVHSLVAAVMEGVGEPHLLLPGEASPHDFALRPSDARAIAEADLVVWVGESLETFLAGVLETTGAPVLELIEAPGVDPLPYSEPEEAGHDDQGHEHAGEGGHGHEHAEADGHDHAGLDPHVWLDPVRAEAMAAAIAERLAAIDAANAGRYRANAARLSQRLARLDEELGERLAPHRDMPVITFHDGYSYLVRRYGLSLEGVFALDPQRRPGARTIAALRERATEEGIVCAFAEPQFDDRMVRRLAEETGVRLGVLDPYGVGRAPGPDLYFEVMQANAASVAGCLSSGRMADEPRN